MSTYCVGCDNIDGHEKGYIQKVIQVLEKAGHTCENLGVGPNVVQSKGLKGNSKGKIGVYLVGGSDIGTYVDFAAGLKQGYYHYKYAYFAFCSWTAHSWITEQDLKNKPLVRAHDDNFSSGGSLSKWIGKSADYFFSQHKDIMDYVYGQTPEELGERILNGNTSSKNSSSSSSSIKEALKEVISAWDGDIECFVREDTVYVQKIADPTTTKLSIIEFQDVGYDSISLTDINPQTPNILNINYKGIAYEIKDEELIERFGENVKTISINDKDIENKIKEAKNNIKKYQALKLKYKKNSKEYKRIEEYIKKNADKTDKNKILQEYIEREWKKLQRDNGRTLELEVKGNSKWKGGQWVRVYLPSFNIDDYMYISKMSQDDSEEWTCNLTLVDYPPSLGKPTKKDTKSTDNSNTEEILDEEN